MSPLIVVLMAIENHVDAVVLEELGDGTHLRIAHGGVARGKRRLMKYHNLPGLGAGIEIVDQPVAQDAWIRGKCLRGFGIERRVVQLAVEEVRVGVEKHEVGAAGVERKVVHVVDLLLGALACVN